MTHPSLSTQAPVPAVLEAATWSPLALLPWIFAGLGMLAPLALVAAAALGSADSAVRAQMIVQGCQLLVFALMSTVVLAILYAAGLHEAGRLQGDSRNGVRDTAAA
jgi:hypothetical protein